MQSEKYNTHFNVTRFIDITYQNAYYILYAGKPYL